MASEKSSARQEVKILLTLDTIEVLILQEQVVVKTKLPDMLSNLNALQGQLQLTPDEKLATYLGIYRQDVVKFRANPEAAPLPQHAATAVLVALGYLVLSDAVLMPMPAKVREKLRAWEQRHAAIGTEA